VAPALDMLASAVSRLYRVNPRVFFEVFLHKVFLLI
jgi:hypothetical protein